MADKKSYRNIQFKKRTKRQQLITPTASLQSLFSGSTTSINVQPTASTSTSTSTSTTTAAAAAAATTTTNEQTKFGSNRSSKKKASKKGEKDKPIRERWLLTRKTWKYMTDAGRKLIPDYIQNRGNTNDPQDLKKIEEYFQHVCGNEPKFLPIFRRKQSFPGALGVSPFRRSGKLRHTSKWFGRSSNRLAPISDNKSSGSSNVSSPPTKLNSADESEDEGYTANDSQRMFLIIEMLEKYLKLSSDAEPLIETDGVIPPRESSSSANEYDSSAMTSPDNLSPPAYGTSSSKLDDVFESPEAKKYSIGSNEDSSLKSLAHKSLAINSDLPIMSSKINRRPIGSQHTGLLLENLRNYGRSSRSSLLSSMNFTPAVLKDKQLLRRIRDELKQQQLDIILNRHSRRPMASDTGGLRLSTSLYTLPTLKSVPPRTNASDENQGITYTLTSVPHDDRTDNEASSSHGSRVPLISIKYASQEKPLHSITQGIQTDPIPVNNIYQQYHSYLKRQQEREKAEKEQQAAAAKNALSKSMSAGCKSGLGDLASKHSKRKSSIDNEDVSQSVSDTIKRYLRMARKKPANDKNADQFKRINYDDRLRNIMPKAEIPKPDELDVGNTKCTQTNENWCEIVMHDIKTHMPASEIKNLPFSDFPPDDYRSFDGRKPTSSSSMPTSPTSGFFQTTGSWSKDSIFGHKKEDTGGIANMQKSKSSTNVGQVFSKKIWKSRSKSQTRPDSPPQPHWTPQGNCIWKSASGKYLELKKTHLQELSDVERKNLQRIALDRINQLNMGVKVKLPSETTASTTDGLQQPKKRRALLLKRKALTTSIFDSSKTKSDGRKGSTSNASGGLIFGQPLEKCISGDNPFGSTIKQKGSDDSGGGSGHKLSRKSRLSITSLDAQLPISSAISSDGNYSGSCDSLCSKQDTRFTASNSGDSLSDTGGYANNQDGDDDISSKLSNGSVRQNQPQVPPVILACIDHLTNYGLHVVGIFRVGTSQKRIKQLREGLDCGTLKTFEPDTSPHDVASLLKEYLRDLPEPLLCRSLYPAFLSTQKIRNRRLQLEALSHLIQLLPIAHRDTLYVLLKFLALVARNSDDVMNLATNACISVGNKMDSSNLATVIAPNILHSNTDVLVATDEQNGEHLDVINVVRTMIDHYEEIFSVPPDVMDDVYTVMMESNPEQLDYIFDRKDGFEMNNSRREEPTISPKKSPGPQVHAHFFPPERIEPNDLADVPTSSASGPPNDPDNDQPRRMYVREQFTHENTVRGNVADSDIRRRERSSRTKSLVPEQESVFYRRRRRIPSSSSAVPTSLTDDPIRYNLNISPPTSPTSKSSSSNEVLLGSLRLPVQMVTTSALHADVVPTATPLSLTSDLSDIPYIEDAETNNGYRTASTATVTPPQASSSSSTSTSLSSPKSLSTFTKKSGFPLTKLKSQFKPAQLTLSAVPIDQGTKDIDKVISTGKQAGISADTVESIPHSVPMMTAITNIGGDMMRSKTAEFERIMTNQQQQQQQQNKPISKSHSQNIQSHGSSGSRTTDSKIGTPLKASDSSSNIRNGPIYKRRDVISSPLNTKK